MQIQATPKNSSLVCQSREITESFPQLTGLASKYWDKFIELLRQRYEEVLTARTKDGKKLTFTDALRMIKYLRFDPRSIDYKHWDRVVDAANQIHKTKIVLFGADTPSGVAFDKNGQYYSTDLIASVDYKENMLTLEFSDRILTHFFGKELTVEYDAHVKSLLEKEFSPILYQRCCILENRISCGFEMKEDDIRLALGIDVVCNHESINNHIIRKKEQLEITKGNEYDRFDDLCKIIRKACDEINKLASDGIVAFTVVPEKIAKPVYSRRRGAPSKEHSVYFKIFRFVDSPDDDKENIEDADAVEITPESITPPPVADSQVEMALEFSDESEQTKALIKIREQMTSILNDSKATHTKKYVNGIIAQIKGRLSNCPELPSMVLAWIKFSNDEIKANKGKASEVAKFIQANLKYHCQLFYKGSTYTGNKLPEYPPGYEPVIIEVSPCDDSSSTQSSSNIKIINNNNNGKVKPNSSEARRAKLSRDANEAVRSIKQRPYIPKVQ